MSESEPVSRPAARLDGKHLDLLESRDEWTDIDQIVQAELSALDVPVRSAVPGVRIRAGSNRARTWNLFSYRVYEPPPASRIDPVVVGLTFALTNPGSVMIRGDVCGETLGDIRFEMPQREVTGKHAAEDAARDISRAFAKRPDVLVDALQDTSRQS